MPWCSTAITTWQRSSESVFGAVIMVRSQMRLPVQGFSWYPAAISWKTRRFGGRTLLIADLAEARSGKRLA